MFVYSVAHLKEKKNTRKICFLSDSFANCEALKYILINKLPRFLALYYTYSGGKKNEKCILLQMFSLICWKSEQI